jgi:hypothetical protein
VVMLVPSVSRMVSWRLRPSWMCQCCWWARSWWWRHKGSLLSRSVGPPSPQGGGHLHPATIDQGEQGVSAEEFLAFDRVGGAALDRCTVEQPFSRRRQGAVQAQHRRRVPGSAPAAHLRVAVGPHPQPNLRALPGQAILGIGVGAQPGDLAAHPPVESSTVDCSAERNNCCSRCCDTTRVSAGSCCQARVKVSRCRPDTRPASRASACSRAGGP